MFRVLHINDYPANAGGGAEIVMGRTIALLQQHGVTTETFTSADLVPARLTPWGYIDNAPARRALAEKLTVFRPDVVHLHNFYHVLSPGILAALAEFKAQHRLRVVMTAHDYHLACPNSGGGWFRFFGGRREVIDPLRIPSVGYLLTRRWDERSALHSVLKLLQHAWSYRWRRRQRVIDLIVCPSRFVQRILALQGLPTCWLPHPVPPLPTRSIERAPKLQFVFAGRVEPEKGLRELLAGWPVDFPARLCIIGAGADLARCRELCASRGIAGQVEFVGRLPHAETLERIAGAHVLVQPSRVLETYGLTLIEALAVGTNLLAADRGAAREICDDAGVGFLYDLDDPCNLTTQLDAIRQSFEAGTLNRFEVGNFLEQRSVARHVEALFEIYQTRPGLGLRKAS
jgi:glycosyltransferase involved in cell wall biosynthesis